MSTELMLKAFFAGIFSFLFLWVILTTSDDELEPKVENDRSPRYRRYISGGLLPGFLLVICLLGLKFHGVQLTGKMMLTTCFDIFLHISIYYVFLMLILPFLRKHINARTCAMLWLLPNYLYLTQQSYMELQKPLFIIHTSSNLVKILCIIWAVGFVTVLSWNIINHLHFRKKLLRNAVPVTNAEILDILHNEISSANILKPKFQPMQTPDVDTPITIGLFLRNTKILLPEKQYSDSELQLIFRHELIHISREDSWTKFFMVFCTSMCWFNPLMWIAMKKSAEDIELSCDETVLLNATEETRREYANLILTTAGNDRGFSTCLSSTASTMRYRLKAIVKPGKRRSGAVIAALTFFLLCMTCGHISLAYGEETGTETVFRGNDPLEYEIDTLRLETGNYNLGKSDIDFNKLTTYIAELRTQEMTGNYSFSDDGKHLSIWYNSPEGLVFVYLYSDYIEVYYVEDDDDIKYFYHLPDGTDWNYIDSILPPLPQANVILTDGTEYRKETLEASILKLEYKTNSDNQVLQDCALGPEESAGLYTSIEYTDAAIEFSMPLAAPALIVIDDLNSESSYEILQTNTDEPFSFELPDYPARYTIHATFRYKDGEYDTTFVFYLAEMLNL